MKKTKQNKNETGKIRIPNQSINFTAEILEACKAHVKKVNKSGNFDKMLQAAVDQVNKSLKKRFKNKVNLQLATEWAQCLIKAGIEEFNGKPLIMHTVLERMTKVAILSRKPVYGITFSDMIPKIGAEVEVVLGPLMYTYGDGSSCHNLDLDHFHKDLINFCSREGLSYKHAQQFIFQCGDEIDTATSIAMREQMKAFKKAKKYKK